MHEQKISRMSLSDFLKDLPTYNRDNFTRIHSNDSTTAAAASPSPSSSASAAGNAAPNRGHSTSRHRPAMYVPTKDYPYEQEIVTERTNILLRYLHQQLDKKIAISAAQKKREAELPPAGNTEVARKKARLDPLPNGSNTDPNLPSTSAASSYNT